jgi:hypothetical protein
LAHVCVKSQKENRQLQKSKEKKLLLAINVIYIENQEGTYTLTSNSTKSSLRIATVFFPANKIMAKHQLVFFIDGVKVIHNAIEQMFPFIIPTSE